MSTAPSRPFAVKNFFAAGADGDRLGAAVRNALVVFGVVAAGYVASTATVQNYLEHEERSNELAVTLEDFKIDLLQMRRNEKDFFERKSQAEADKHAANHAKAVAALTKIKANPEVLADELTVLQQLFKDIETYRTAFVAAAELHIKLGVDENSGLQGSLRAAVREAEKLILAGGLLELEVSMLTLRRHEKDFILRERPEYIERFGKEVVEFGDKLRVAKVDAATRTRMAELIGTYEREFRAFAAGTLAVNDSVARARTAARAAEQPVDALVETAIARSEVSAQATVRTLYTTAALLLLSMVGVGWMLVRARRAASANLAEQQTGRARAEAENEQLNNSVIAILQSVHQLSERDLTVRAPVTQDVIGTVSDSINLLTEETVKVLAGVSAIAGQVETVSGNVRAQAQLVSKTAADERRSVEQMTHSLASANEAMNHVATLAEQSNAQAAQATAQTETALETVNGTVKGMESIRETIAETEKRIKRLGERSQEITGIVNLINTISERTHVLALNASMQAAVAGEAGRGFAVVAEEVQRLAESSRNATQQIGTLVGNIQLETNETIATVNRTIGQVVAGSELAQKAGEQMRRTQTITGALVQQVQRIAESSEEQKLVSAQLLRSVQHIGQSTERTAQQIESQNQETDTLLAQAKRLVASVNVFKLPQAA